MKVSPKGRCWIRRATLTALCLVAIIGVASPASAQHRTITVPAPQAAAIVASIFGGVVPPWSCIADFIQPGCPVVSEIVISLDTDHPASEQGDYMPLAPSSLRGPNVARAGGLSPLTHGISPGFACATIGHNPTRGSYSSSQGVDYFVRGKSENSCRFGVGISWMEITSNLERDDGGWGVVATAWAGGPRIGGDVTAEAEKNCNHPGSRNYRTFAQAYSVRSGTGYFGTDRSGTVGYTCPDSF